MSQGVKRVPTPKKPDTRTSGDHRGYRGVPPLPVGITLVGVGDDVLLTEIQVAAFGQLSTNTLQFWRRQPDHPLRWTTIFGGRIRYRASDVKNFFSTESPRQKRRRPKPAKATERAELVEGAE